MSTDTLEAFKAMDWVPIVFVTFKILALGTGMFFAIKWHYDQRNSPRPTDVVKVLLEGAGYILAVLMVFALIYGILHYLGLLPAGLDFY